MLPISGLACAYDPSLRLLSLFLWQLIRAVQPIHDPKRAIIQPKLLMMQIVKLCRMRQLEKVVTGVIRCSLVQLVSNVNHRAHIMCLYYYVPQNDGEHIRTQVLGDRAILGSVSDGNGIFVVLLVDLRVEQGVMERAVDVIEDDLTDSYGLKGRHWSDPQSASSYGYSECQNHVCSKLTHP